MAHSTFGGFPDPDFEKEYKAEREHQERFAKKDRIFEMTKLSGKFPALTCKKCNGPYMGSVQSFGCCERDYHHIGDCCLHCGNDERKDGRKPEEE